MVVRNSRGARRVLGETTRQASRAAELSDLPVQHPHAAGIDVGDQSHWACVGSTPDGSECVREFPAHTAGLRQLVAWLKRCGVTTIALEATGVYGHANTRSPRWPRRWTAAIGPSTSRSCAAAWQWGRSTRK